MLLTSARVKCLEGKKAGACTGLSESFLRIFRRGLKVFKGAATCTDWVDGDDF